MSNAEKIAAEFSLRVVGKTIKSVRYQSNRYDECSFPVIELSDGSVILVQGDDEGNNAGVPVHMPADISRRHVVGMWEIRS